MSPLTLDTSVAIPLLVQTHRDHAAVSRWWDHREAALSSHALAETYSVLSEFGIAGGAVYDALVALAAIEHDAELATRDGRAKATYDVIGARVTLAG